MADKPRSSREQTAVDRRDFGGRGRQAPTKSDNQDSISAPTVGSDTREIEDGGHAPGSVVGGRYRILELLGAGGMGAVYRARDLTLGADVALKMLAPDLAGDLERVDHFRSEVLLARRVTHPNVCRLHDIVEDDGGWFITMEHVDGESLADRLRRADDEPIDLRRSLAIIRDVARGLAAAHAVGVVHRDLKPANILLAADSGRAVIADFGIAVEVNQLGRAVVDRAGTRGYMSPEQAAGGDIDARTDVFALGVLAHRMLAGELPPAAPTTVAQTEESDPPEPIAGRVPEALAELISRCLRHDPRGRYADASEVLEALEALDAPAAAPASKTETETAQKRPPRPGRKPSAILAAIAGLVVCAGALAMSLVVLGAEGPLAMAPPRQIVIAPIVAARVDQPRAAWIEAALGRRLVDELDDAWALPARLDADPGPELGARDVSASLSIASDPRGLVATVSIDGGRGAVERTVRGATVRELSVAAARAIVAEAVPRRLRRPNAVDLSTSGSSDAEAWRLVRRSQRASARQLWPLARELSAAALERDPRSVAANLEHGWTYSADDPAQRPFFEAAIAAAGDARLDEGWRRAVEFAAAALTGEPKEIAEAMEATTSSSLTYRQRWYFTHRIAYAQWYTGAREDSLPHLEALEARYPRSAGAAKMLATHFLDRDDAEARDLALQHARLAVDRGADDVASRSELARALLWSGDRDAALAQLALIEAADDEDKRSAIAGGEETNSLFDLYMALGDLGGADRAARRLETGSIGERGRALLIRALLQFYRGDRAGGFERARAAAAAFDESKLGELTGLARIRIVQVAHSIGDSAAVLEAVAGLPPARRSPFFQVVAAIARHRQAADRRTARAELEAAAAIVEALPEGHTERAFLGVLVAAEAGDWPRVLSLEDGAVRWRRHIEARYLLGVAREKAGEPRAALAHYEKLAMHRYAWSEPIWAGRALLAAARVRAELGDRDGARDRYRAYLDRHDRAPPSHAGVAEARRALETLGRRVD